MLQSIVEEARFKTVVPENCTFDNHGFSSPIIKNNQQVFIIKYTKVSNIKQKVFIPFRVHQGSVGSFHIVHSIFNNHVKVRC